MNGLRWTLGVVTTLVAVGWVALAIVGSGFRQSFGGSENPPWLVLAPIVIGVLVGASLVWPERRMLLHVVAVLMVALCIGCAFLAREAMFVATLGILYAVGWLTFYYRAVWAAAPGGGFPAP